MTTIAPIRDADLVVGDVINQTEIFRSELNSVRLTPPTITSEAQMQSVTEEVRAKKDLRDKFEKFYEPFKQTAFRAHRATVAHETAVLDPLTSSIKADERAIGAFIQAEEKKRRDEAARIQEQTNAAFNKEIDKRAKQLTKAGKADEADELRQQAEYNRPIVSMPEVNTPKGVTAPTTPEWDYEVVNPDLVPRQWCSPDPKLIAGTVKLLGKNTDIPGVRIFPKEAKATVRR